MGFDDVVGGSEGVREGGQQRNKAQDDRNGDKIEL